MARIISTHHHHHQNMVTPHRRLRRHPYLRMDRAYSQYGGGDKYSSELAKLRGMGFDSNQAKRALQKHNGDVDKAVNELLGM